MPAVLKRRTGYIMNTYQNNFSKVKETYANIFSALDRVAEKFDIGFYLIGAQCRDVWSSHLELQKRLTRDIDFAVEIENYSKWESLKHYLIGEENMTPDDKEPYRFYLNKQPIDIIPFGGISNQNEVKLYSPVVVLSIAGLKEVTAKNFMEFDKHKVVTIGGLCVLKLISYGEKPDKRKKDFEDFLFLLSNYLQIQGAAIFEDDRFHSLLETIPDVDVAAANVLSWEMKSVLGSEYLLLERVVNTLENELKGFTPEEINEGLHQTFSDHHAVKQLKLICEVLKVLRN